MDERIRRLREWSTGNPKGPYKVQLNPTNRCNLNCISCTARGRARYVPGEEVSIRRYLGLIGEAAALGAVYCDICGGGEPLRRPGIMGIIKEIKKHRMVGSLISNGTLLTESRIRDMIMTEWDFVNLSLDGPTPGINDPLRGKGTFAKVATALEIFQSLKKGLGAKKPDVCVYSVLSSKNYQHIPGMIDLARRLGLEGLYFQPVTASDKSYGLDITDARAYNKMLTEGRKLLAETGIKTNIELIEDIPGQPGSMQDDERPKTADVPLKMPCYSPWLTAVIRADGTCGPCPPGVEFVQGCNIKNQSLKEVWFGRVFSEFREKLKAGTRMECCGNCGSMERIANRDTGLSAEAEHYE
ncbi:MAG: radical SAM protein [archaeon]